MELQLYSKYCVDIVFGDGQLGFRIGKTEDEYSVVKGYDTKEDGTRLPLEGSGAVIKGDYIIEINGKSVVFDPPKEVKSKLKNSHRPMTVRFARPCSKSQYKTVLSPSGEKRVKKWNDSDTYLPVCSYVLDGMNNGFIMLRDDKPLREIAFTPIYRNGPIFEPEVREVAFNGLSDFKQRANVWKMLLRAYPYNPSEWSSAAEKNQSQYSVFVHEFIESRYTEQGLPASRLVPSPLDVSWKQGKSLDPQFADSNESPLSRGFGDNAMREIIWKDTLRTYSDVPFFVDNRDVLARVLFVFGKLNAGVQYVQGMNELLAPVLFCFASACGQGIVGPEVEADAFFAFNTLMSETRDLFIREMDSSESGMYSSSMMINSRGVLDELHEYIASHSMQASQRLDALQIDTQFFAMRWLTTLFAREFSLDATCRIWDALLADPQRFMFMYCVATGMVELLQDQLQTAEFAEAMRVLQDYPEPELETLMRTANRVRLEELMRRAGVEEEKESAGKKLIRAGADLAEGVGGQVMKGWNTMKMKGIPMLAKFAQDTKSRVVNMTKKEESDDEKPKKKEESDDEKPKKKEESDDEKPTKGKKALKKKMESESEEDEKPKKGKKSLKKKMESKSEEDEKPKKGKKSLKKKMESESEEENSEEEEDDDVALLFHVCLNKSFIQHTINYGLILIIPTTVFPLIQEKLLSK